MDIHSLSEGRVKNNHNNNTTTTLTIIDNNKPSSTSPSVCVWCGVPVVCVCCAWCLGRTEDTATNIFLVWGGVREPQRGFLDGAGFKAGLAGPFGCGRPCDHQRQAPVYENVEVPQFQFIDRVVDFSVVLQRHVPTVSLCRPGRSHSCSSWTRFMTPVVVQRQVLGLTVQKTVDFPQLQYLDKVVDDFFVQFIEVVDVPVIIQRRGVRRHPCRGANADSLGLPSRFSSCCPLMRCSMSVVQVQQVLGCRREEDSRAPTVAAL